MRTLRTLDAQYGGEVAILAIDTDPFESPEKIRSFWERNAYSWPAVVTHRDIIADYGVTTQSTKVAVGRDGVILFRSGYSTKSGGWWEEVFTTLARR